MVSGNALSTNIPDLKQKFLQVTQENEQLKLDIETLTLQLEQKDK